MLITYLNLTAVPDLRYVFIFLAQLFASDEQIVENLTCCNETMMYMCRRWLLGI